jgi:hypothetical protein
LQGCEAGKQHHLISTLKSFLAVIGNNQLGNWLERRKQRYQITSGSKRCGNTGKAMITCNY